MEPASSLHPSGFDPSRLTDSDILELAGRAVREVRALPAGYLVDPGSGSAMDRLQRNEPTIEQCCDMARRGGFYETLYTGSAIERVVIHAVRSALENEAAFSNSAAQGIDARQRQDAERLDPKDESPTPKGMRP